MSRIACALVLLGVLSTPVRAQEGEGPPPPEETETPEEREARQLYEQGLTHYNVGEYDQAIDYFKRAYKVSNAPGFLFNIAQAYRLKGDCAQAVRFYETYIREWPDAPNRDKAEEFLEQQRKCAPKVVKKEPDPKPPVEDQPKGGRALRLTGMGIALVGLAAVGTGLYFGVQASDAADEIAEAYEMAGPIMWTEELENYEQQGQRDEILMIAFTAGGAVAIGVGIAIWTLGVKKAKESRPTASIGPDGATVGWAFSW
jgi:tetratricopeptide (TPR) repeat protein